MLALRAPLRLEAYPFLPMAPRAAPRYDPRPMDDPHPETAGACALPRGMVSWGFTA